ncbi:MAG: hypothetical protein GXO98_01055 [Nitrospirae bacterium]|nr:hypothetical protein [Nitrospirota bacterium]
MSNRKIMGKRTFLILPLFFFILVGCARNKPPQNIAATVNGEPIYVKDLKREIARKAQQDPSYKLTPRSFEEQLNIMINRRLLIQEAMKKKLAGKKRFVNTIRSFWEQTLIRDLMDYKKEEEKNFIFVTEEEVKDYYQKLSSRVTFKILRSKDKKFLEDLLNKKESIKWEKTIGPVTYEDINSKVLLKAFSMKQGEIKIFPDKNSYYLVSMTAKESLAIPPLSKLYPRIKERIREEKQRRAFEEWLGEMRSKAKIKINRKILPGENNAS